jgi:ribosomal protein S18 acetylase RimI-like enzyme
MTRVNATIVTYVSDHFDGVKAVWRETFPDDPPWNVADVAIPAKLAVQPDLFLVAVDGGQVIGSIMAGYDGHRGWLYAVAVLKSRQRQGVGTALVREAEIRLRSLGCDKINLQIRASNPAVVQFYQHLGYAVEDRISMDRRIGTASN